MANPKTPITELDFDNIKDNLKTFLNWADISKKDFYECINKHRDPKIWNFNSKDNKWKILTKYIFFIANNRNENRRC